MLSCYFSSSSVTTIYLTSCSNIFFTLLISSVITAFSITFLYSLATITMSLSISNISAIILSMWSSKPITALLPSAIISLPYSLVTNLISLDAFSLFYISPY